MARVSTLALENVQIESIAIGQDIEFNSDPDDSSDSATHIHNGQITAIKKYKKQISIKLNTDEHIHNYFTGEIQILSISTPKTAVPIAESTTSEAVAINVKKENQNKNTKNTSNVSAFNVLSKGWSHWTKNKKKKNKKHLIFGADTSTLDRTVINHKDYESGIPNVLIKLKYELFLNNGHLMEGIFRKAPIASECKSIKDELDNDKQAYQWINFSGINPMLIANLIKIFFRDLPNPILHSIGHNKIEMIEKTQNIFILNDVVNNGMDEPNKSYFKWLLDLCVDIVKYENVNKMTCKNMAVVMAPNLYDPSKIQDHMKLLTFSNATVVFLQAAIQWRMKQYK